ncbi:hypothetical protein B0T19DRAFT_432790 [Cercophora scortea]|uniref:NmrA-like domain-containing protein n=1 Tax=Cercophora scortea TaxID=314031 RepID=A0AAE0I7C5_9PEZI|nr:hypothetical protein B0T19DRAFT_432790 [Cercophora scortea]
MPVIAVAGGTGNVGQTIVDALLADKKYEVIVLSRNANEERAKELGVQILAVDYTDVVGLTKTLEDHNVHTLISAIVMWTKENGAAEVNLIKATDASRTTKRMISSDWAAPMPSPDSPEGQKHPASHLKHLAWTALKATTSLEEWTVFRCGVWLDYYVQHPSFESHFMPFSLVVDTASNKAAIPGDGNTKVSFIHSTDLARFVVASLELSGWEHVTTLVGDKMTWNEFVGLVEGVKGTKFDVVYDDVEKLERSEVTELPSHVFVYQVIPKPFLQAFLAAFGLWFTQGLYDLDERNALEKRLPGIRVRTARELFEKAWGA